MTEMINETLKKAQVKCKRTSVEMQEAEIIKRMLCALQSRSVELAEKAEALNEALAADDSFSAISAAAIYREKIDMLKNIIDGHYEEEQLAYWYNCMVEKLQTIFNIQIGKVQSIYRLLENEILARAAEAEKGIGKEFAVSQSYSLFDNNDDMPTIGEDEYFTTAYYCYKGNNKTLVYKYYYLNIRHIKKGKLLDFVSMQLGLALEKLNLNTWLEVEPYAYIYKKE